MQTQRKGRGGRDDGYILLALLLIVALMTIAAAITVPKIAFEIKRDREEEMIHRGVQYSRAIRAYYKKFGRYPTKIEDLESSNNMRFLRKRYKDLENCKAGKCEDFKLLHFGDVQMAGSLGGGTIPGANTVGQMNGANGPQGAGGFGQSSTFGNSPGINTLGGGNSFNQNGATGGFGSNGSSTTPPGQQSGGDQASGTDTTDSGTPAPGTPGTGTSGSGTPGSNGSNNGSAFGNGSSNPMIGGGPIVGVTSGNKKDTTIREFNHKKKYSDWQFIYDPGTDRGSLIMTPNQPPIMGFGQQGITGATPVGNMTGNGFSPAGGQNNGLNNSNSSGLGQQNPTTPQPTGNPPQQ